MSLRHALLGLLAEAPMSGYDLLKRFEHSLSRVWPARHNQIYTELKHLLDRSWIEQVDYGPRGRKIYAITEAGQDEVRRWLREEEGPVDHGLRFEPLLRANFLWLLKPQEARDYLKREAGFYAAQHAWLQGQMATLPADDKDKSVKARLVAADAGLRFLKAMADWAEAAQARYGADGRRKK